MYTTTYVIRSSDEGRTCASSRLPSCCSVSQISDAARLLCKGSPPSAGNLTDMLLEGDDGISMMQFGEGQGVVLPSGELLVCGWFKLKGRPPGELDKTDSIACLSSTVRTRLFCWTQGSP